ncbi:MAG: sugar ABC transporter ATP-binding protein [Marinibacterium sp.]
MPTTACSMTGIEKSFGPNRVLRRIDLHLPKGQVTVLMGANGAGKSTLVKVLCGVHQPDAGTMTLFGAPYAPVSPADAQENGVVTVHQSIDDGVAPDLDVASNLLLDRLATGQLGLFLNRAAMRRQAREIAAAIGLEVDVRAQVADLGVADRQMVAIARAMTRSPKVLVLDEPTSSLSSAEADRLFAFLDNLRRTGVAILYISHRMSDIRRIADRIVTMRDGRISGVFDGPELDYEGAVTAMLGEKLGQVDVNVADRGDRALVLDHVQLSEGSAPIDLVIHHDEVVAITGLLGSGKSALAAMLFGLSRPAGGRIELSGETYAPGSPKDAISQGVFLCSKDRATNGVIPDFDIADNMALPFLERFSALSFLREAAISRMADRMIADLGIVCQGNSDSIGTLSGGNQQKVMVARWLAQPSRVLVLDEPFQGVDIKARRDIGNHIRASAKGRATIVFAAEVDEALEIADRVIILHEQALVGEHINRNVDLAGLLAQYSGGPVEAAQTAKQQAHRQE